MKILLVLFLSLTFAGCKEKIKTDPRQGYILGANNMEKSTADNSAIIPPKEKKSFVLVSTTKADQKLKFCSGVVIAGETDDAPQRVVTNHHCFAEEGDTGDVSRTLLAEACLQTKVYFGYYADQLKTLTSGSCKLGSLKTHYESDLAVFSLNKKFTDVEAIAISASLDVSNRKAYVVHFPDVKENYVAAKDGGLNLPVATITQSDCATQGNFSVEDYGFDRSLPFGVQHTCDIIHGSSGSALVDATSNEILGIDWGGIKIKRGDDESTYNVATRAEFVRMMVAGDIDKLNKYYEDAKKQVDDKKSDADSERDRSNQVFGCQAKAAVLQKRTENSPLRPQVLHFLIKERGWTKSYFEKKFKKDQDLNTRFWVEEIKRSPEWSCKATTENVLEKAWCSTLEKSPEAGLVTSADYFQELQKQSHLSDEEISLLKVAFELKARRYSETLQITQQLNQKDTKYRFLHNQLQELYAIRQKGEGKALLRQN